jgi:hypothetical protein
MSTPATETEAKPPEAPPPSSEAGYQIPKRRVWPVLVVLAAIFGGAGFLVYRSLHAPETLRVLIAVDFGGTWWEGSEPAAVLADKLAARLSALGFDPVKGGDPEVEKVLQKAKTPEEAAAKLRAAFVVTAKITPEVTEHPVEGGFFELRVDAPIRTRQIEGGPGEETRVRGYAGARDRASATRLLADSMADQMFDAVLPVMTRHPSIVELFTGRGADPKLANQIAPARNYVEARDKALEHAASAYKNLEARHLAAEKGPAKVTYHGPISAADLLCGAGPAGFLTRTNDITPFFNPDTHELGWIEGLETLEWRKPEGEKKVLWSGYHVFTYPSSPPEGAPAVLIEDLFGWAKTVTVVEADGRSRRVRVDPKHRFIDPRIAPGGKAVALYDRDCQSCESSLAVLDLEAGKELFRVDHTAGVFGSYAWLDAQRLVYAMASLQKGTEALWVVDVRKPSPKAEVVVEAATGEGFAFPAASADGHKVALQVTGRGGLGVVDVEGKKLATYDVHGIAYSPEFSPDGGSIAFVRGSPEQESDEVAVLDIASGTPRVLTKNPYQERYPEFSADGSRIYFESHDEDPAFPGHRYLSVIASVPARP